MLPGEALRIAIRLGNDRNKDQTFEFALQALVYGMGFEQPIVWIFIEVDGDIFFERGIEFGLERTDKLRDPMITFVVLLAVGDKNVILKAADQGRHIPKIGNLIVVMSLSCGSLMRKQNVLPASKYGMAGVRLPLLSQNR